MWSKRTIEIRRLDIERGQRVWCFLVHDWMECTTRWWWVRIGRDEVIVDVGRAGDVATLDREDRVGVSWAIVFIGKGIHMGDYFGGHRDFCDVIRGNDFASVQVVQLASTGAVRGLADADGSVCAKGHDVVRITSSLLIVAAKFELGVDFGVRCTVVQKLEW